EHVVRAHLLRIGVDHGNEVGLVDAVGRGQRDQLRLRSGLRIGSSGGSRFATNLTPGTCSGQPLTTAAYASASSSPSVGFSSLTLTLMSQPSPYGSELMTSGVPSSASLRAITSPETGTKTSETDLVDSSSPTTEPAVTASPSAGRST